jgi:hypothetical protein
MGHLTLFHHIWHYSAILHEKSSHQRINFTVLIQLSLKWKMNHFSFYWPWRSEYQSLRNDMINWISLHNMKIENGIIVSNLSQAPVTPSERNLKRIRTVPGRPPQPGPPWGLLVSLLMSQIRSSGFGMLNNFARTDFHYIQ